MELDAAQWEAVQALFHRAVEIPPDERPGFLATECASEPELIPHVFALLEADMAGDTLLDASIADLSSTLLDEGPRPGATVGPYRILSVIGEGGMGVVYLAERTDVGSRVAIKMPRDAWVSPESRARFEREQRTLASLNHPAIARFLDAATLPSGAPYFVIEYVDGIPITDYCAKHGLGTEERLRLFRAVCEAVRFAHHNAIIHRDIKPSNILVTADGTVKLLDFGIAKQLETIGTIVDPTVTRSRMMTPAYAAPEQARGEMVGVYTDVYSLGILLYEILCGRTPFVADGRTPGEVEVAMLTEEPERPSTVARRSTSGRDLRSIGLTARASDWRDLDVICLKSVQKDPARRYASVEALVRDIDNLLAGRPLEARPDTLRYRAGKFVRRNRGKLTVGAAVGVGIIALSGFYAIRLAEENRRVQLEAAKAEQVSEYLIGLFETADPFGSGEPIDVRTLLAEGEARTDELASQPEVQAQMLDVLGRVQTMLSDYPRADALLDRALTIRRDLDPASLDVAETLSNVGVLRFHDGDYEAAEEALREALEIRRARLPASHRDIAETLDNLAVVLGSRGDYATATELHRDALRNREAAATGPTAELGQTLNNLAVNLYNQGDLAGAEELYLRAIANDRAVFGATHPTVATNLANLARVYQDREEFDRAEALLDEALEIRLAALGDEHFETAVSHSQLGALRDAIGDPAGAEEHHREALRIREALLGPDHPTVGTTLNGLALVQHSLGDYGEAEVGFRRAVEIYALSLGAEHRFTAVARCNLASTLHRAGRLDEAESEFRECVAILESIHEPGHPELAFNQGRMGALLVDMGGLAEAEPLLRRAHAALLAAHGAEHQRTRDAAALLARIEVSP